MSIDLYHAKGSSPCRVVLLAAAASNVEVNDKLVNVMGGEHLTPEYLKINPQHTVPTMVDGGFALAESHAIIRYLANKYGDDSLYPEEPKARAVVDQRLDFNLGTLYLRFGNYFYPQLSGGAKDEALLKKLEEAIQFLETFLEGHKYAAGPNLTLADLALVVTVSNFELADISIKPYPNVERWFELVKSTAPQYEETEGEGVRIFKQFIDQIKAKK